MVNSTHHHHGHVYPPDPGTKFVDEMIILGLGAIVFMTFAAGLVVQLCDTSTLIFPRKYHREEEENSHTMADLEPGTQQHEPNDIPTTPQPEDETASRRWAARYGSISEYAVDLHGVRKTVLVVNTPTPSEAGQDGYTEWLMRWHEQRQEETSVYASEQVLDECSPLVGELPEYRVDVYSNSSRLARILRWMRLSP